MTDDTAQRVSKLAFHVEYNEKFARWQFMVTTALLLIILGFVISNTSRLSAIEARLASVERTQSN